MYHAIALEDILDLVNVLRAVDRSVPADWAKRIAAMRNWLSAMRHPDGEISFFNDAAIGIAPTPDQLEAYALRLGYPTLANPGPGLHHLAESGYIRLENESGVALLDVGRIGADYLPGHAHADTLCFELSVDGRRILVNSGTSVYGVSPERLRQRSTAAHNAVVIDNENSSEVWSGFRVARRARPYGLTTREEPEGFTVICAHGGYRRLPGRPRHRRAWWFGAGKLAVVDHVQGNHGGAVAVFHFHPALAPTATDASSGTLTDGGETVVHWRVTKGKAEIAPATWHPEFGIGQPTHKLLVTLSGGESRVAFTWSS